MVRTVQHALKNLFSRVKVGLRRPNGFRVSSRSEKGGFSKRSFRNRTQQIVFGAGTVLLASLLLVWFGSGGASSPEIGEEEAEFDVLIDFTKHKESVTQGSEGEYAGSGEGWASVQTADFETNGPGGRHHSAVHRVDFERPSAETDRHVSHGSNGGREIRVTGFDQSPSEAGSDRAAGAAWLIGTIEEIDEESDSDR